MLRKKPVILLLAAITALAFYLAGGASYNMKNIDNFITEQVDKHQTPSIHYAFFDADNLIYEKYSGFKNVGRNEKADPSTTYHLYSVTKTFTALAVLQLAQSGKLDLEKPVAFYFPDFPYPKEITIRQLLSHSAGIPNPLPLRWIHLASEHEGFDRDTFFAGIFKANPKLAFEPGTNFKYSNLGYVLLGQLVEKVSGLKLEDYVNQNIIAKSGADASELSFHINPATHATGYHKWWSFSNAIFGFLFDKKKFMGEKEGLWKPFHFFYNNGTAYGGLFGSATGLRKYAQSLLKPGSVLLKDEYKKLLFTETEIQGKPTGMSLSWYTGTLNGHRYVAHAGGGGGYYVELRLYPDLGMGSVILYNRSGMTDGRILDKADSFFFTD